MSGVLRVLSVEPPADIVNKPKNTVATVKSIAAMMTITNRSIVRLPEQCLPAPPRNLSDLHFPLLRSWQKPRFLPAETQLMSEKAPQATFSNELGY
jgi:hypothetical protein